MEVATNGLQPPMLTPRVLERYRRVTWAVGGSLAGFGVPALKFTVFAIARTGLALALAGGISAKGVLHPFSAEMDFAAMPFTSS